MNILVALVIISKQSTVQLMCPLLCAKWLFTTPNFTRMHTYPKQKGEHMNE